MLIMDSDTKQSEVEVYDGENETRPEYGSLWDEEHHQQLLNYGPEGEFDQLLEEHVTGDVLILGCGKGERTAQISNYPETESVCGIELSRSRLETAVENNGAASFLRADAEQLPFSDCVFDTVVAHSVLHHLPNWRSDGLSEIKRTLGDDGVMLFYEPGRYNPPAALRRAVIPSRIHTPDEHPFDPKHLSKVLADEFTQVNIEGHCLFSNVLPVVDGQIPISIPFGITRRIYNAEQRLFDWIGFRMAWIMTGIAVV
jgi:SAM-dependent methyltransferase